MSKALQSVARLDSHEVPRSHGFSRQMVGVAAKPNIASTDARGPDTVNS